MFNNYSIDLCYLKVSFPMLYTLTQNYYIFYLQLLKPYVVANTRRYDMPGGDNLVKDVQCYELFGGIALKNHAFSFF